MFSRNGKYDEYLAWEELLIEQDLLYESIREINNNIKRNDD